MTRGREKMKFDDDFIELTDGPLAHTRLRAPSWPPPSVITIDGCRYRLTTYSTVTDDERAANEDVARGALYAHAGH